MTRAYRSPHGPVPDLPGEEWRDFEDLWEVSNLGRFKAKERIVENPRGLWRQRERLLKLHRAGEPGRQVLSARYQVDGHIRSCSIYRAMWEAFRGPLAEDEHLVCVGPLCLENLRPKRGYARD
jgi:hypothetical protein